MDQNNKNQLFNLGSEPISKPTKEEVGQRRKRDRVSEQLQLYLKTHQTFGYHVCDVVAQQGWRGCQKLLNEMQRNLEHIYETPCVELVNVYRKNNTKDDGICIVAIFKIGPMVALDVGERVKPAPIQAWWARLRGLLKS